MTQQRQLQKLFASYYQGDELQQYLMVLDVVDPIAKAIYPLGDEFDHWGSRMANGHADLHPQMAAFYRQLGESQLLGTSVPQEHGGPGMPFVLTCAILERLAAGMGLGLTGTTFAIDPSVVQARVAGTCPTGSSIRAIAADGTVSCEVDDDVAYMAGMGLSLTVRSGRILRRR